MLDADAVVEPCQELSVVTETRILTPHSPQQPTSTYFPRSLISLFYFRYSYFLLANM